jgi:hypothetical protein
MTAGRGSSRVAEAAWQQHSGNGIAVAALSATAAAAWWRRRQCSGGSQRK